MDSTFQVLFCSGHNDTFVQDSSNARAAKFAVSSNGANPWMDIMRILLAILLASMVVAAQESRVLPDAPSVAQTPASAARCGPWSCWNVAEHSRPWSEVVKNKTMWTAIGIDLAAGAFDVEMSHEGYAHHRCVEGGEGLPPHASRAQLYKHNVGEQVFVIAYDLMATKIKMPRWLLYGMDVYPIEAHMRAGLRWYENCW